MQRFSGSTACRIFLDQGSTPSPLYWQADSQRQEAPSLINSYWGIYEGYSSGRRKLIPDGRSEIKFLKNDHYWIKLGSAHPLVCSKANLLTLGCREGKCSIYYAAPSKDFRQLVLKRPKLPNGFRERILKTGWGREEGREVGGVWSAGRHSSEVDGEVVGGQHHQPSGSKRTRVYTLVGSTQLTFSTWWSFHSLQNS